MSEQTDEDIIRVALFMRANHIETGDVNLSADDALDILRAQEKTRDNGFRKQVIPKTLTDEQRELVSRLRKLARELFLKGRT
jgi:hypothetical protein